MGFILAAAGSAVGLANVWKFPYMAYENGGTFVLIYLLCLLVIGFPLLIGEMLVGKASGKGLFEAFGELGKPLWNNFGYLCILSGVLILGFYCVVGGWCFFYAGSYAMQGMGVAEVPGFGDYTGNGWQQILSTFAFVAVTIGVVMAGVMRGIEQMVRYLMPLLGILLLVFAGYATSKVGFSVVTDQLFTYNPDTLNGETVLKAVGHAFFSLSLGIGAMLVFASYLKEDNIVKAGLWVGVIDTAVALVACFVVIPMVLLIQKQGGQVDEGAGALFVAVPALLSDFAGGNWLNMLFFFLLSCAALTSSVSLFEVVASGLHSRLSPEGDPRKYNWIMGAFVMVLALITSLSVGANESISKLNLFTHFDDAVTLYLLPLGGLLIAIFVGWLMPESIIKQHFGKRAIYPVWRGIIRYVTPLAMGLILLQSFL